MDDAVLKIKICVPVLLVSKIPVRGVMLRAGIYFLFGSTHLAGTFSHCFRLLQSNGLDWMRGRFQGPTILVDVITLGRRGLHNPNLRFLLFHYPDVHDKKDHKRQWEKRFHQSVPHKINRFVFC